MSINNSTPGDEGIAAAVQDAVAELSMPEQITRIMADVARIQELKDELAETVARVRTQQSALARQGCVLSFPVLDSTPAELESINPNLTMVTPVIPPRTDEETRQLVEPADDQLSSHEETKIEAQDSRTDAQIQKDAFVNPDPAAVANFQVSIESTFADVVSQGFKDADSKARNFGGS